LPWQPNLDQKIALISSLQEIGKFIACTLGTSGLLNFNTLSEILREPRELPWQLNLNKNKPKLHRFQFCARNRGIFRMKSQDFGSATSNMLSQFSRKLRELPWQPNSEKYKPKLHKFLFLAKNGGIFRMFSMALCSLIQMCYLNFQGS